MEEVHQSDDEARRAVVRQRTSDRQLERHLACADRPRRPDRDYWLHYLVLFRRRVWSEFPLLERTAHRPATGARTDCEQHSEWRQQPRRHHLGSDWVLYPGWD